MINDNCVICVIVFGCFGIEDINLWIVFLYILLMELFILVICFVKVKFFCLYVFNVKCNILFVIVNILFRLCKLIVIFFFLRWIVVFVILIVWFVMCFKFVVVLIEIKIFFKLFVIGCCFVMSISVRLFIFFFKLFMW